ncbi:hypothetical protein KI688_007879 [Linnemannia hyalina]|uniref:Uncharacterized protein n=1 Tax=Linnemannia hyalina TaxID=64524 RepID=A0A9P7XHZ1_9FUNG|nr:hypothetical protein KI688_007879 [Linnemannia hyalina]
MSNNTRLRKRSSAPLSEESSSRPPSPTQQQQPSKRPPQGPAPALPIGVPAAVAVTQQVVYTALSMDEDEEQEGETDEEDVEEDEGDEDDDNDDDDEEEEEEEEEDGTESEEQDDSQDEDYEDEEDNEDNCKRRKDFDKNRREYENDMLHRQREQEGESDVHADDEASSQEDSSQGSPSQGHPAAAATAPVTVIDEEEVEDGEEPEMLETVEENYQRFYSHGDFDGDDSSSAMGGAGSTNSSSRSSSSDNDRRDDNGRYGNGVSASSSLSSSASTPKVRSRYTSGLAGGGEQFRNHTIQEPLPGTLQTCLIEIDSLPPSENGEEEAPRVRYHPEHFIVRERINDMYRLLAHNENFLDETPPSSPTSPLSASRILALSQALSLAGRSLNTVSDLMDLLVRTYLPQFWLYRAKNKHLNRFARKQPKNPRPRESTLLATCVDCGFKFEKTPVFAPPATVRKVDNEKRAVDNKKQGRGSKNTRAAAKERALISATFLRKYYQDRFPGAGIHYWNSHLTPQDVDDIFNNNRQEDDYDGNLDHFGLKEEGHHVDCPTNFYSTSEKATKLHFGWDLAVGYQHSGVPRFPNPQRTAPPPPPPSPCPPQPHCHSLAPPGMPTPSPSPRSSPPRTPKPGSGTPPPQHQQHPHSRPHTYYPSRSLMASFCHLLPRDLDLTTNDLRKLFTYFVWHPWFDCDFQAITIRRGYEELWPLFLLRDEDDEVTEQEKQVENGNIFEIKKKKRLEAALRKLETKKNGSKSASKRKQKLPMAPKAPEPPLTPAYIEYKRQTQMETRFTTSFERGLSNHGVIRTIRNRSLEEYTRVARQVRWGWVFGPRLRQHQSQDLGQNQDLGQDLGHTAATTPAAPHITHFEKNPTYPGSIHIFTANDRTLVEKGGKLYFEPDEWYPVEEIPRFQNTAWTRPERADALDRLKREVKEWWNRDAEVQRKKLGFMLPEFARVRRWPAGMLEMVAGKLVFEVDKSAVEKEEETETLVAQTRTPARATTKLPPAKTRQARVRTVNRRGAYMDIDYSPSTSTTDRYRPVTRSVRTARSTVAAAPVRNQSQVQDMDMDVEMTTTSTSRARAVPPWEPSTRSGRGQQQPSQPQHYQVRTPGTTAISTSSPRTQLNSVQPHFMTVIPSTNTNTNVNTVARPMAVATGLPTTFSLANFSTGAGPMTTSAKPPTTLPSSRVNTVARKMVTVEPPSTTFPSTNLNTFPSTNTYINTVAGLMESAGPFASACGIHATNVDNFISNLTNPKADFWEIYNQYMQSGGSYEFIPVDNNAAQKQDLVSTAAAAATPTVAQSQSLNSLLTPGALLAQYYSSHPAEPTMGFQGILPGQATIAPTPYFSVSGQQNNGMNDMSQFLNMGAMRDASIDKSPSSLNGNDLKGGFARMKIGDRLMMMDIEVDEDPKVTR